MPSPIQRGNREGGKTGVVPLVMGTLDRSIVMKSFNGCAPTMAYNHELWEMTELSEKSEIQADRISSAGLQNGLKVEPLPL